MKISVAEAAKILGTTSAWVKKLFHAGRITGEQPGREIWLDEESVLAYRPKHAGNHRKGTK